MGYSIFFEKDAQRAKTNAKTSNNLYGNLVLSCIDAGSENCPCYLASTGDCLTCTRLQGKDYCDCSWAGVCIYNEYIQGNHKTNNPRKDFEAHIVSKKFYKGDLVIFVLNVGKGFAIKVSRPGSYVFIKGINSGSFYDVPISVMKSDIEKGQIHLAVKIISAKTKSLLLEEEKFLIRGPYRNGIQGVNNVIKRKVPVNHLLIIAKGIGIAPGILTSNYLVKTRIDFVIDHEKISKELISDYLNDESVITEENRVDEGIIKYLNLSDSTTIGEVESLLKKNHYDAILILTSDYYMKLFGDLARKILPSADVAFSNNFKICCGEGLCGSCSLEKRNGEVIKMCKCNLSGDDVLAIKE